MFFWQTILCQTDHILKYSKAHHDEANPKCVCQNIKDSWCSQLGDLHPIIALEGLSTVRYNRIAPVWGFGSHGRGSNPSGYVKFKTHHLKYSLVHTLKLSSHSFIDLSVGMIILQVHSHIIVIEVHSTILELKFIWSLQQTRP